MISVAWSSTLRWFGTPPCPRLDRGRNRNRTHGRAQSRGNGEVRDEGSAAHAVVFVLKSLIAGGGMKLSEGRTEGRRY